MNLYCPNCGKKVLDEDAIFCPYCSKPLRIGLNAGSQPLSFTQTKKHSSFPTAAGILSIISACIVIIFGILGFQSFASNYPYYINYRYAIPYFFYDDFFIGLLGTICFGLGLTSGILSIKRKRFALSIIGSSLLLVTALYILTEGGVSLGLLAIPIFILSILSVVFIAISKGEFTNDDIDANPPQENPHVPINVVHRQSLVASIWSIGVGIALSIIGSQIGSMFIKGSIGNYVGLGLLWMGIIVLIVGVFGLLASVVLEYFERR